MKKIGDLFTNLNNLYKSIDYFKRKKYNTSCKVYSIDDKFLFYLYFNALHNIQDFNYMDFIFDCTVYSYCSEIENPSLINGTYIYLHITEKEYYRLYLIKITKYINMSLFLNDIDIDYQNYNKFIHGDLSRLSLDRINLILNKLYKIPLINNH
ncbi:MAG: hypothetical protein RR623_08240 [Bacilli bacterium]